MAIDLDHVYSLRMGWRGQTSSPKCAVEEPRTPFRPEATPNRAQKFNYTGNEELPQLHPSRVTGAVEKL